MITKIQEDTKSSSDSEAGSISSKPLSSELRGISDKLCRISRHLEEIDSRLKNVERKTADIHRHVPFVNWLEGVGSSLSRRIPWLGGGPVPVIEENKETSDLGDE